MAFVTATDIRNENTIVARISAFVAEQAAAFADYRLYRRTVNELSELSSAELSDLGMSRASIVSVAYASVYGE
ncbi:Uncharacterized conserved protein YjiS, DUF1127 family [Monaibacterium marinum]|uniref:Uncharacterized conserved protein YjiS, DUF1127 family n=1 Tax=Pontivivens marinum TaxID=1690039 RepID=A0A2C9CNC9_9RHOB|nr:DUF1127 domain-containing protein [Monaibacterium marinum]SOH92896.1 Uncharacterized conserved protein YjiS, DUF1127 family [Monaibacterium marinum]